MAIYDPSNDTYSAKGFISFGATTNNTADQIAPLGELSVRSETYAKDRLLFGGSAGSVPDTSVVVSVFNSRSVTTGLPVSIPVPYSDTLLEISQWCYRQALLGVFTAETEVFLQQLLAEFTGAIADVEIGPMIQQGQMFLPEYVIFYLNQAHFTGYNWGTQANEDQYSQPRFKFWFSDAAFSDQYDEYVFEFVGPIPNLNDFFLPAAQVRTRVDLRTVTEHFSLAQLKAGEDPYTIVKSISFNYHDPLDTNSIYPTNWTILIYGAAGDNIDAIKSLLAEWILDNSTHTREEWVVIFPDIFTSTEFIITPMWTQYSVPNRVLDPGVYSPTVNIARGVQVARTTCTGTSYTNAHIDVNLAVVSCLYKSIALLILGGPENSDNVFRFEEKWRDYMAVTTSSPDFNRMQPLTQEWVNMLYAMLRIAEDMTEFSDIPPGYTRLKRTNGAGQQILYLVNSIQNVQYLVVSKFTMQRYFPAIEDPTALALVPSPSATLNTPTGSLILQVNFATTGGIRPYAYTAASADIASGSINPSTGYLNVQFTSFGTNNLDITVTDALGATYTGSYVVVCNQGSQNNQQVES